MALSATINQPISSTPPWQVLVVCTGNLCRSPMTEYLAVAALRANLGTEVHSVTVSSAGTHARNGMPMHRHAAAVLAERGIDPAGFAARRLDGTMVSDACLVLCAGREHRSFVVAMAPKAVRRTFTLREFARLTAGIASAGIPAHTGQANPCPAEVIRADGVRTWRDALVAHAADHRGLRRPERPSDDDIADPIGASIEAFRSCAEQISAALAQPLTLLTRAVQMNT
ncbi:protein tyrosine phosphatase [Frankia sp. Cas3]|uniref:arsenate reductase/protein-tyrosine-phosphatase family protein n=1 Tax=Frankia sp. Cas3 TaxID=3073926 RepID=UPI002AD53787|nr:protein tyrosine phosphatase [Frankia sp. Cas3]